MEPIARKIIGWILAFLLMFAIWKAILGGYSVHLGKKGVSNLVIVISVVLIGVILIIFSTTFLRETGKYGLREACLQSVKIADLSKTLKGGKGGTENFNCGTYYYNFDLETKDTILKNMADEMFWCYWQFGRGELNFIDDFKFKGVSKCYVCSQFTFSDQTRVNYPDGITVNEFLIYLNNYRIPLGEETYAEYILGIPGARYEVNPADKSFFPLNEEYWVVFSVIKEGVVSSFFGKTSGKVQATSGGLAIAGAIVLGIATAGTVYVAGALMLAGSATIAYFGGAKAPDRLTSTVNMFSKTELGGLCGELRVFPAYEAS